MAVLTVNTVDRAGTLGDPVATALVACAGGGDSFPNTGKEYILFFNGDAAPKTLTEVVQATVDGQPVTSRALTVPAGAYRLLGPYPTATYNDGNGRMNFTYSAVTSCKIGVFSNTTS